MSDGFDPTEDPTKEIVEALLFAADEPLGARRLASLVDVTPGRIADLVDALNADYLRERRAFHIRPIAGGWQIVTRPEFAEWVGRLRAGGTVPRLSQAALETLAIVAYRQPVARTELESVRGVSVDAVLRTLVERDLVRVAGRGEGMGRPLLYGTTDHFLEYFGLPGLDALPRPDELEVLFADRERRVPEDDEASADRGDGVAGEAREADVEAT